ncbi:MAG: macro domain-containing protein, partial [Prochlorothrix sp.]
RQSASVTLALPRVSQAELEALPFNDEVQQEVAVLTVARAKKEAAEQARQGQYTLAQATLGEAQACFSMALEVCPMEAGMVAAEQESLESLLDDLAAERYETFSKRSHYESHLRGRGWSQSQYQDYQSKRSGKTPGQYADRSGQASASSRSQPGSSASGKAGPRSGSKSGVRSAPPSESQAGVYFTPQLLRSQIQAGQIKAIQGDITVIRADAIVNATNSMLNGSMGVDAAIHAAAGSGLKAECRQIKHCDPGQAVLTNAYYLPARWVIHTVGPGWRGGHQKEEALLQQCYGNSLRLAHQNQAKTITFPAIGTGALGCPLDWAVDVAVRSVSQFLQRYPLEQVTFVCFDAATLGAYQARLSQA